MTRLELEIYLISQMRMTWSEILLYLTKLSGKEEKKGVLSLRESLIKMCMHRFVCWIGLLDYENS